MTASSGGEEPRRASPQARAPGPLGAHDWDGLFTVRLDRAPSGTGTAPEQALKVGGESVGTPSDPS